MQNNTQIIALVNLNTNQEDYHVVIMDMMLNGEDTLEQIQRVLHVTQDIESNHY